MNTRKQPRGYQGSYLIGFLIIGVVAIRSILFYWDQSNLAIVISILAMYTILYTLEPFLSSRFFWFKSFYFPVQTVVALIFSFLRPFLDFQTLLYVPLFIQAFRAFSRRAAISVSLFYICLIGGAILPNLGLLAGTAFILLGVAVVAFLISYDFLYSRTLEDQMKSQHLLAELQSSHRKLQEYAAQAEELAAIRERNRLARELHNSVTRRYLVLCSPRNQRNCSSNAIPGGFRKYS